MGNELWCGQAQNWVNSDFKVKYDLEGQGQLPSKTVGTLNQVFCIFGPKLERVSSYRADKQVITAHTDGRTHRQTQATTIPEGQNWPRRKRAPLHYAENRVGCACIYIYSSSSA